MQPFQLVMRMKIAVVMTTYETPDALDRVLQAYSFQTRLPDEIIVADDGSGESTRHVIEKWRAKVSFPIQQVWQENKGYRRSRILNMAIARAKADYLIFTDGDCLPDINFVADHEIQAERGYWIQGKRAQIKEAVATHATVNTLKKGGMRLWIAGVIWRGQYGIRWWVPIIWRQAKLRERALGSNMAIHYQDLLDINGFNEDFVGWGAEDREISVRLHHLGRRKKLVIGRALQFHLDHPPTSRAHAQDNGQILAAVKEARTIRCENGLSHHLALTNSR